MANNQNDGRTMKAIVFGKQTISFSQVPIPVPAENEVLVKIQFAGICSTDIELYRGYHDFSGIPGHEFIGEVTRAPNYPELEGRRVVADINCGCGQCDICNTGDQRHCRNRTVIGIRGREGAFAEYCTVPVVNLHVVPDTVESVEGVFAEPLAAALEITNQVHLTDKTHVAVLGDGKLGILCALVLKQYASTIILVGRHSDNLEIARQQGVEVVEKASSEVQTEINAGQKQFDVVIEATGNPDGINQAILMTRPEGTIVVKTTSAQPSMINLAQVVVNELNLVGSRCGDMAFALSFLENKHINFSPLVEAVYPLSDFKNAFKHALRRGSKKVLLSNA